MIETHQLPEDAEDHPDDEVVVVKDAPKTKVIKNSSKGVTIK